MLGCNMPDHQIGLSLAVMAACLVASQASAQFEVSLFLA